MTAALRLPAIDDLDAELARRDFREFVRGAWPVVEPGTEFVEAAFIDAIADHLVALYRGDIRNLVINVAPRHAKSTIAGVMFPTWVWLQQPGFKFLTSSYAYSLAVRDAIASRRLITSPWYALLNRKRDGSPIFRLVDRADHQLKRLKDLESFYQNDSLGHRRAVGVGGAATGEGGDLVAVDDPTNPMQASSETERERANDWWDQTMSNRGNDPKTVRRLIIMQRLHTDDLTGHVLAKELGYEHLFLPERFNPKRVCVTHTVDGRELYRDPRTEPGELLWPERFGRVEVDELAETMGPEAASGQLDQDPIPAGGLVFKLDWLRHWTVLPDRFDHIRLSWDLNAGEETTGGSFVAGLVWGEIGPDHYLIDAFHERCDYDRAEEAFAAQAERWPSALEKIVEDKAAGRPLIARMRKRLPGIISATPTSDKLTRARAVTGFWRAGNVWIPQRGWASWVDAFIAEVTQFPRYRTDDLVDAMTQYFAEQLPQTKEQQRIAREAAERERIAEARMAEL